MWNKENIISYIANAVNANLEVRIYNSNEFVIIEQNDSAGKTIHAACIDKKDFDKIKEVKTIFYDEL